MCTGASTFISPRMILTSHFCSEAVNLLRIFDWKMPALSLEAARTSNSAFTSPTVGGAASSSICMRWLRTSSITDGRSPDKLLLLLLNLKSP